MKTKAVRLYGQSDLRLEEFELPEIKENEILCQVNASSFLDKYYNRILKKLFGIRTLRVP